MTEKEFTKKYLTRIPFDRTLFRNNIGMIKLDGRVIKYGVCNPGGSDFIGWTEYVIQPDDVGKSVALFTAVELKSGKNKPSDDQTNFLEAVSRAGGIAECVWPEKIKRYGEKKNE
jgi:hypothetical protein